MVSRQQRAIRFTEGVTQDVKGAALERLQNSGNIRGKIREGSRCPAALGWHPHLAIDGDDCDPAMRSPKLSR